MMITDQQRHALVEHAIETHDGAEARFADVIADLAMGRETADHDLLVAFLWQRVTVALEAGTSRKAQWVWSAAVQLLDLLDEDLEDIFAGRPLGRLSHPTRQPREANGAYADPRRQR